MTIRNQYRRQDPRTILHNLEVRQKMSGRYLLHARFHSPSLLFTGLLWFCSIQLNEGKILIDDGSGIVDQFQYEKWPFAASVQLMGIEGAIIGSDPVDACFPITKPPETNFSLHWFVLISGNSCDYDTKVFHSQLAGYSAAIIYRLNETPIDPIWYKHGDDIPNIPAVFITEDSSIIIREKYVYSLNKSIRATIIPYLRDSEANIILLFLFSGGIFLILAVFCKIYRLVLENYLKGYRIWIFHRFKQRSTSCFKKGDPFETCAICLEDFKLKEKIIILSCLHGYHVKCIDQWLLEKNEDQKTCPLCKQKIYFGQERHETRDSETAPLIRHSGRGYYSL